MTTPEPSAVRAWARRNGVEVSGRGRLPAEVVTAYTAAQRAEGTSTATTRRLTRGPRSVDPAAGAPRRRPDKRLRDLPAQPAPQPVPVPPPPQPDSRLTELAADFAALSRDFAALRAELASATDSVARLTGRVTELEAAAARPTRGRFLRPR